MPTVHPTAIVGEEVSLGEDVCIGPGCVVEGRVVIGDGSRLLHRVTLSGPVVLGGGNMVYPNASIGYRPPHDASDRSGTAGGVVIGEGNVIREGAVIDGAVSGRPTTLGDRNYVMVNCHVGAGARIGGGCTLVNSVVIGAGCELADGVILGGQAVAGEGCRLGRLSMVSGLCDITLDLPPFCVVYNPGRVSALNLVGLRRAGDRDRIVNLRRAFNLLYRKGHSVPDALERIERQYPDDPRCGELVEFVRRSSRGITPYGGSQEAGSIGPLHSDEPRP